jgi:hypothetical protein
MEKEFIPYEQALALKELGFDEECFWWYDFQKQLRKDIRGFNTNSKYFIGGSGCSAPLYQQCFRWFREKYNLKGHVEAVEYLDGTPNTYHWCIFDKCNSGYDQLTYEEAELECLKKLIEIVKQK